MNLETRWRDAIEGAMAYPRTVLTHGVFDLLHLGHIRHLQEARQRGDRLVVSVTADDHIHRGPGRPAFTAEQRVEALRALDCVDEVFIAEGPDATHSIARIQPAVYVKGTDYLDRNDPTLRREVAAVTAYGGSFHITSTDKWSSSRLLNGERLSEDAMKYLESARARGFLDQILAAFDKADKLKIAFIGETIIDEYRYVSPLGKPAKECIIATVETREKEAFEGGVIAASKQAEWLNTNVITSCQAMRKTRYIDPAYTRKLFEVYSDREIELNPGQRSRLQCEIEEAIHEHDVVVVLDFGHGLLGGAERSMLMGGDVFLAVNAQTNTGNYGYNPITKYTKAEYACIDEPEARLATGLQIDPLFHVMGALKADRSYDDIIITNGRLGSFVSTQTMPRQVPAFLINGIDTMGAGDAFLAATAPLIAAGLPAEAAALVGNVAGGLKVGIVGHRAHVTRQDLIATIETLLK